MTFSLHFFSHNFDIMFREIGSILCRIKAVKVGRYTHTGARGSPNEVAHLEQKTSELNLNP